SVVGRCPNTGNRKTNSTFDPSDCTSPSTPAFSPFTTDEMTITVITPITIPRIVRPLRSLFVRSVSSAITTVSLKSAILINTFPAAVAQLHLPLPLPLPLHLLTTHNSQLPSSPLAKPQSDPAPQPSAPDKP